MTDRFAQVREQIGTGEDESADGTLAGRALWARSKMRRASSPLGDLIEGQSGQAANEDVD